MSVPLKSRPGRPPAPDVDAIVQGVRARVADRLARGLDSPEQIEAVRRIEGELRERADFGPALADDIALLHTALDPLAPHAFTSHRAVGGGLIVGAKQLLRRLVLPVAALALVRQVAFNGAVARLLTGAARGVQSLEAANDALRRRLEELERRNLELQAHCERLEGEVRDVRSRLPPGGPGAQRG